MNEYKEYLNVAVLQENKPVTYKALARSLGIHVNTAKQALFEFCTEHENTVYTIYCITGVMLASDQFTIKLVKGSEVEETKRSYKQITGIHVYSVAPVDTNDFSLLYTACKDFPKSRMEDRIKSGILKNTNVTFKDLQPSRPVEVKKPITSPAQRPTPAKPVATPTKTSGKRKGTLTFGPTTTKKQAIETPKEQSKPVSKTKSNIFNQNKKKNDDEDIEMRMAKATIKPDDIFTDDEEEEEKDDIQPEAPQEPEDLRIDDDDEMMEEVEPTKEKEAREEEIKEENHATSTVSSNPGKAMRKVLRKKTTKNARGFLVTEEVWEMEEMDESELPKPKPVIHTKTKHTNNGNSTSKKAGSNSKSGAQTDLLSFFKKK